MNEDHALQDSIYPPLAQEEETSEELRIEAESGSDVDGEPTDISPINEANEPILPAVEENSDPLPTISPSSPEKEQLDTLSRELAELRQLLSSQQLQTARVEAERAEFSALYPDVALSALPDGVWEDVRHGVPLAAAYALAERRALLREQSAALSNQQNASRAAGTHRPCTNDPLSPAEVRAMSPSEVRRNYTKIMQSMQQWN